MKKLLLTTCLSLIFFSGTTLFAQDGKYRIKGSIDPSFDGQLAILKMKDINDNIINADTTVIFQGIFSFQGNEYLDNLSNIIIENTLGIKTKRSCGIMLESGTISITYPNESAHIEGTHLNELFIKHRDTMKALNAEIEKISPEWTNQIIVFPNTELGLLYYKTGESYLNFAEENFSNPLGKAVLLSGLTLGHLAMNIYVSRNGNTFDETFAFVDEETKAHPRFIAYREIFKDMDKPSPYIGKKLETFDFLLTSLDTKMKKISDFTGKKEYTFVEFWASWCSPCLASIPELKEIYGKYSNDLEIISVSLDTKKDAWLDALKEQDMPWPQLSAPEGFKSDIAEELDIKGIPFGLLLDKNGEIIYTMLTAASLNWFMETH